MNRNDMLAGAQEKRLWDFLVVGGGATGLGIAVDAAARGYSVLLVERDDFAKGSSSRSTKLIHGGVRYLQQGNVTLVLDALKERGLLRRNAPHLVHDLAFIVPSYAWWESPFYGVGLKVYDLLAGEYGFGTSRHLDADAVLAAIPQLEQDGLRGGTLYYDAQFDDARLAIALARTASGQGACLINYCEVTGLNHALHGQVKGASLLDHESGAEWSVTAKVVINACGPFSDGLRRLDRPDAAPLIAPSRGVHLVVDGDFLAGDTAIMVPHTDDGRVLFAIPWLGRVLLGTTDTAVEQVDPDPLASEAEIDFILHTACRYLSRPLQRSDIRSLFAGIRPLVRQGDGSSTASLARDHSLLIDPQTGLLSIAGGKWTTYRHMAEDCVDLAASLAGLPARPCPTRSLAIHGAHPQSQRFGSLAPYGSDAPEIQALIRQQPELGEPMHPELPLCAAQVLWACRQEMARHVEDVLARRSRCLLLDAKAAGQLAAPVAALMAAELGHDTHWQAREIAGFQERIKAYLPAPSRPPA